jgi:hypothetical protein
MELINSTHMARRTLLAGNAYLQSAELVLVLRGDLRGLEVCFSGLGRGEL